MPHPTPQEPVLDATTQLAMAVSLVVWVQFGIPSASGVLVATSPYPTMRLTHSQVKLRETLNSWVIPKALMPIETKL
ncbi:unnamed protein product [Urochloa humidicola]